MSTTILTPESHIDITKNQVNPTVAVHIALHRTFERDASGDRKINVYVSDGKSVKRYSDAKLEAFILGIAPGTVIRCTSVNSSDAFILRLHESGAIIKYAHWHSLGIEKSLEPDQIALQFAKADDILFREFKPSRDIQELRTVLALRNALVQYYGNAVRRIKQTGRNVGLVTDEAMESNEQFSGVLEMLLKMRKVLHAPPDGKDAKGNDKFVSLETQIVKLAKQIPDCVRFNEIAKIENGWVSAATIVALAGGVERFDTVSAFWKYFGQDVVDGVAPKRKIGTPSTWNPAGRTAIYLLGDSIIKNRNNPWRQFYEEERAKEIAMHDVKHPGCKTKDGHCTARAKRKMCKEILKRFYVAVHGAIQGM